MPRVPYQEWITIFKTYSKMVAAAQKQVEKEHPELFADIVGRGNVIRLALAKIVLPALRKWAISNPGVETEAEIKNAVVQAVMSVDDNALAAAMKEVFPGLTPDQVRRLLEAFHYMKNYLTQYA